MTAEYKALKLLTEAIDLLEGDGDRPPSRNHSVMVTMLQQAFSWGFTYLLHADERVDGFES